MTEHRTFLFVWTHVPTGTVVTGTITGPSRDHAAITYDTPVPLRPAADAGHHVAPAGIIPRAVVDAYHAAHPETAA